MADTSLREQAVEAMARALFDWHEAEVEPRYRWKWVASPAMRDNKEKASLALDALRTFLAANGLRAVPVEQMERLLIAPDAMIYGGPNADARIEGYNLCGNRIKKLLAAYPDPLAPSTEAEGE